MRPEISRFCVIEYYLNIQQQCDISTILIRISIHIVHCGILKLERRDLSEIYKHLCVRISEILHFGFQFWNN